VRNMAGRPGRVDTAPRPAAHESRCDGASRSAWLIAAPVVQTRSVESFERRAAAEGRRQILQAIVGQPVQVQTAAEDGCEEQDGEEGFQVRLPE